MTDLPLIPGRTDHVRIGDPKVLYRVIDEWYEGWMRDGRKPGSELWTTMLVDELVAEIESRWSAITGLHRGLFPWKSTFVALLAIKKRKEPDKRLFVLNQNR
jgi:hypothetical protein